MPNFIQNTLQSMLRTRVEKKIKKYLSKQDVESLRAVRGWLDIAKRASPLQQNAAAPNEPKDILKFVFQDGKTLTQYMVEESNRLVKNYRNPKNTPWHHRLRVFLGFTTREKLYLLPAQDYPKKLLLMENDISNPLPGQKMQTRLLAWFSKRLAVPFDFTAKPLTLQKAAKAFYRDGVSQVEGTISQSNATKNTPTRVIRDERGYVIKAIDDGLPIREHHTPQEILNAPKILKGRLGIKEPKQNEINLPKPKTLPDHLSHFHAHGKPKVAQVLAIDQLHQQVQQQQLNQHLDIEEDNLLASVQLQVEQFSDTSDTTQLEEFEDTLEQNCSIADWLKGLRRELVQLSGSSYYKPNLFISQNARDILIKGKMFFSFSYQIDIDLNQLPLGFFLDRGEWGRLILKFSPELRAKQLKDPMANLRQDLASVVLMQKDSLEIREILEQESLESLQQKLFGELTNQGITVSNQLLQTILSYATHKAPVDIIGSSGDNKQKRYGTLLTSVYKQLHRILLQAGKEHFLTLLIQLEKMSRIDSRQYCQWNLGYNYGFKAKQCSLLDHFLGAYFPDDRPIADVIGEELSQEDAIKMLNQLTHSDNVVAQQIFAAIINSKTPISFYKAYHAAMTVQNHFRSLNIKITDALLKSIAASDFRSIERMITLSSHSIVPALQTQLALADEVPSNTVLCTRLLDQGYSFVAECMDLSRFSGYVKQKIPGKQWLDNPIPMLVDDNFMKMTQEWNREREIDWSREEETVRNSTRIKVNLNWDNTNNYQINPYFVAWFRYLAYQVDPHYIGEALQKWKDCMGQDGLSINYLDEKNLKRDTKNLEKHWVNLVDYVLALPKKMAMQDISENEMGYAKKERNAGLLNEQLKQQSRRAEEKAALYSLEAAKTLCESQLKLTEDETKFIQGALQILNDSANEYRNLSPEQLLQKARALKQCLNEGENLESEESLDNELEDGQNGKKNTDLITLFAILRELNYRWTTATSKAIPPRGEWLRMEQAITILLTLIEPAKLFQVDTSEGKTLIISMSALLHALKGSKTNIYTHNETFATEYFDKLHYLTQKLEITLAEKKSSKEEQIDADILCIDISSAVINFTLDRYEGNPIRNAQIDLADEVDNHIDIQANTTMQISSSLENNNGSPNNMESFFIALAEAYVSLKENKQLVNPKEQIAFVRDAIDASSTYWDATPNEEILASWLAKMVIADQKELNTDYIIEEGQIRIVHHTTTGRVDRESIWGGWNPPMCCRFRKDK